MKTTKIIQAILVAGLCFGTVHLLSAYQRNNEATSLKKLTQHRWYLNEAPEALSFILLDNHTMKVRLYCKTLYLRFTLSRASGKTLKITNISYQPNQLKCPNNNGSTDIGLLTSHPRLTIRANKLYLMNPAGDTKVFIGQ